MDSDQAIPAKLNLSLLLRKFNMHLDQHHQVDLIMLDFSKAFDTVPHNRLLHKLKFYGIRERPMNGYIYLADTKYAACCFRWRVIKLCLCCVWCTPGHCPGPILFLLYINNISTRINSSVRLFADNCVLYRIIKSDLDHHQLQPDLDLILTWSHTWQM